MTDVTENNSNNNNNNNNNNNTNNNNSNTNDNTTVIDNDNIIDTSITSNVRSPSNAATNTDTHNVNHRTDERVNTNNNNNSQNNNLQFIPEWMNRPRNNQNALIGTRDRLFHALFYKAAIAYAQAVPRPMRRILEMVFLMKAICAFVILIYIHITFSQTQATCLDHVKDDWPRDGILRVEVSYYKKYQQQLPEADVLIKLEDNNKDDEKLVNKRQTNDVLKFRTSSLLLKFINNMFEAVFGFYLFANDKQNTEVDKDLVDVKNYQLKNSENVAYFNETLKGNVVYPNETISIFKPAKMISKPKQLDDVVDHLISDERYVVEYSLEYGFLRLSPATRLKYKIPVRYVSLNPKKDKCFGDAFSRFILKEFLGYDDLLMASVKVLAEQEDNKGYLRNVITGEHYRFVSMWWMARSSFIAAMLVMILFTVCISMLLRYSHHQIFMFIVELLQMIEFNVSVRFPAAPLLTVILALVGMEAIMSEFFNDTTTAFYIILIVWFADQYDAICCHSAVTRRHFLRFFYLYHFSFYSYHYRFNGQYSGLALITSFLFIQHAMLFFFHHYELPLILTQARLHHLMLSTARAQHNQASATDVPPPSPNVSGSSSGNNDNTNTNQSMNNNEDHRPSLRTVFNRVFFSLLHMRYYTRRSASDPVNRLTNDSANNNTVNDNNNNNSTHNNNNTNSNIVDIFELMRNNRQDQVYTLLNRQPNLSTTTVSITPSSLSPSPSPSSSSTSSSTTTTTTTTTSETESTFVNPIVNLNTLLKSSVESNEATTAASPIDKKLIVSTTSDTDSEIYADNQELTFQMQIKQNHVDNFVITPDDRSDCHQHISCKNDKLMNNEAHDVPTIRRISYANENNCEKSSSNPDFIRLTTTSSTTVDTSTTTCTSTSKNFNSHFLSDFINRERHTINENVLDPMDSNNPLNVVDIPVSSNVNSSTSKSSSIQ